MKNTAFTKPFLKWAGGKTQLFPHLLPLVPGNFGKYIEPFIGGGAMFFALGHTASVISDSNEELIITYTAIRDNVEAVIETLNGFKNTSESFYEIRSLNPTSLSLEKRAARLIYLNKTCFNGLYRVNRKGHFNTPYNNYQVGTDFIQTDILRNASKGLQNVVVEHGDYKDVLRKHALPNDFIFLDPPYQPLANQQNFTSYTKEQFYEADQIALADEFRRLVSIGCRVILTNSSSEFILDLYKEFSLKVVKAKRLISRNTSTRLGEDLIVLGGI